MHPRNYMLTSDAGHVLAQAETMRDLRAKIECWYPLGAVSYRFDEYGEGWAFAEGKRLGYIEAR